MRTIALIFFCFACAGHGRRVQTTSEQKELPDSANSLSDLLLANQPAAGFQVAGQPLRNTKNTAVSSHRSGADRMRMGSIRDEVMSEGIYEETNMELWDPLGLATWVGDGTLGFFREAELKHGRVAMLAAFGYLVGASGFTFPGYISKGVTFKDVNAQGVFNAWANTPENGKLQILLTILILEIYSEAQKPHYMKGGALGDVPFFKGFFLGGSGDLERLKKAEMKHGRLAMFGIISFLLHHANPTAVPILGDLA